MGKECYNNLRELSDAVNAEWSQIVSSKMEDNPDENRKFYLENILQRLFYMTKEYRYLCGNISHSKFCMRIGWDKGNLSSVLNGERGVSLPCLSALCSGMGYSSDYMLGRSDIKQVDFFRREIKGFKTKSTVTGLERSDMAGGCYIGSPFYLFADGSTRTYIKNTNSFDRFTEASCVIDFELEPMEIKWNRDKTADRVKMILGEMISQHGFTKRELASALLVSTTALNRFFNEDFNNNIVTLVRIARMIPCTYDYLMGFSDHPEVYPRGSIKGGFILKDKNSGEIFYPEYEGCEALMSPNGEIRLYNKKSGELTPAPESLAAFGA